MSDYVVEYRVLRDAAHTQDMYEQALHQVIEKAITEGKGDNSIVFRNWAKQMLSYDSFKELIDEEIVAKYSVAMGDRASLTPLDYDNPDHILVSISGSMSFNDADAFQTTQLAGELRHDAVKVYALLAVASLLKGAQ